MRSVLLPGDRTDAISAAEILPTIVRQMADVFDSDRRHDDVRAAADALAGTPEPDVEILAAVHDGLQLVSAGSPTSWFDVPSQRRGRDDTMLGGRRGN